MAKDLFSDQASLYAAYRPTYPAELFTYLLQFVKNKTAAWDCATGNGQAAIALSRFFKTVYATDISEQQLKHAVNKSNIKYSTSAAEKTSFDDKTFDLITVAQAYHWLDFSLFEKEAKRVAKQDAIIAIWGYGLIYTAHPIINNMIRHLYSNVLGILG